MTTEAYAVRLAESYIANMKPMADAIMATFQDGIDQTKARACWDIKGDSWSVSKIFDALEIIGHIAPTGKYSGGGHTLYNL